MIVPSSGRVLRTVVTPEQITTEIQRLAGEITTDYAGRHLHLLVVLKGAFIFAADLVRRIDLPITLDFIRIASYCGTKSSGGINLASTPEQSLRGQDVLIVEDILDTGLSLDFLMKSLSTHQPRTIRSCVLISKNVTRRVAVEPDYCGFSCSSGFLVGYGLDCDEQFRNLPGIYELG